MLRPRIAVALSWLLTALIIGWAIFSTPYMRKVLHGEAVESAAGSIVALVVGALVCGWPWLLAFILPASQSNQRRQYVFAVVAVALACVFFTSISEGHDFAVGLFTIFCVLSIWLAYPLTRIFRAL
jgi:hypothetical protein